MKTPANISTTNPDYTQYLSKLDEEILEALKHRDEIAQKTPQYMADAPPGVPIEAIMALLALHAEGDEDPITDLIESIQDPEALQAILEDGRDDDDPIVKMFASPAKDANKWQAAQTKKGTLKAVRGSQTLYGQAAKRALDRQGRADRGEPEPETPKTRLQREKQALEPARQEAREAWRKVLNQPHRVSAQELQGLSDKLSSLTRDEVRTLAKQLNKRVGGVKAGLVKRLVDHAKTSHGDATKGKTWRGGHWGDPGRYHANKKIDETPEQLKEDSAKLKKLFDGMKHKPGMFFIDNAVAEEANELAEYLYKSDYTEQELTTLAKSISAKPKSDDRADIVDSIHSELMAERERANSGSNSSVNDKGISDSQNAKSEPQQDISNPGLDSIDSMLNELEQENQSQSKPDEVAEPIPENPEATLTGFTGIDAQGREWRDGKLVAKQDEPTETKEAGQGADLPDELPPVEGNERADTIDDIPATPDPVAGTEEAASKPEIDPEEIPADPNSEEIPPEAIPEPGKPTAKKAEKQRFRTQKDARKSSSRNTQKPRSINQFEG